jgi:hypothetical protein
LRLQRFVGELQDELVAVHERGIRAVDHFGDERAQIGGCEVDLQVAGLQTRDVDKRVHDGGKPLRLGSHVLKERATLLVVEVDVVAEQRLRKAVDRSERRAQLVGDGRDEPRLHLLDETLGGDIPEGEDTAGHFACRIAHDRLAQ